MKRLIQNARDFNERGSQIADDAERLRKAMANFMPKHNPKYSDPTYKAIPTPIPGRLREEPKEVEDEPVDKKKGPLKIKLTNKRASTGSPAVATPAPKAPSKPAPSKTPDSFEGKTFQEAQEMIMEEMIDLKDEELVS